MMAGSGLFRLSSSTSPNRPKDRLTDPLAPSREHGVGEAGASRHFPWLRRLWWAFYAVSWALRDVSPDKGEALLFFSNKLGRGSGLA